jgi:NAD+ synthase
MHIELHEVRREIMRQLGTGIIKDIGRDADRRVQGLEQYLYNTERSAYVLGVSGGVDSTTSSILAQTACRNLRSVGRIGKFVALRLPYGVQRDEDDAQHALDIIKPDQVLTINIKPAVDAMMEQLGTRDLSDAQYDFIKGNVKARQRMIAQYAVAGMHDGLVIGTDHASEALMGFFTKFGDGAADVVPKWNLTKGQVRQMASFLGVPESLAYKVPTADLEDLKPGLPDEVAYGVTYEQIDAFLLGEDVSDEAANIMITQYRKTAHKRDQPVRILM